MSRVDYFAEFQSGLARLKALEPLKPTPLEVAVEREILPQELPKPLDEERIQVSPSSARVEPLSTISTDEISYRLVPTGEPGFDGRATQDLTPLPDDDIMPLADRTTTDHKQTLRMPDPSDKTSETDDKGFRRTLVEPESGVSYDSGERTGATQTFELPDHLQELVGKATGGETLRTASPTGDSDDFRDLLKEADGARVILPEGKDTLRLDDGPVYEVDTEGPLTEVIDLKEVSLPFHDTPEDELTQVIDTTGWQTGDRTTLVDPEPFRPSQAGEFRRESLLPEGVIDILEDTSDFETYAAFLRTKEKAIRRATPHQTEQVVGNALPAIADFIHWMDNKGYRPGLVVDAASDLVRMGIQREEVSWDLSQASSVERQVSLHTIALGLEAEIRKESAFIDRAEADQRFHSVDPEITHLYHSLLRVEERHDSTRGLVASNTINSLGVSMEAYKNKDQLAELVAGYLTRIAERSNGAVRIEQREVNSMLLRTGVAIDYFKSRIADENDVLTAVETFLEASLGNKKELRALEKRGRVDLRRDQRSTPFASLPDHWSLPEYLGQQGFKWQVNPKVKGKERQALTKNLHGNSFADYVMAAVAESYVSTREKTEIPWRKIALGVTSAALVGVLAAGWVFQEQVKPHLSRAYDWAGELANDAGDVASGLGSLLGDAYDKVMSKASSPDPVAPENMLETKLKLNGKVQDVLYSYPKEGGTVYTLQDGEWKPYEGLQAVTVKGKDGNPTTKLQKKKGFAWKVTDDKHDYAVRRKTDIGTVVGEDTSGTGPEPDTYSPPQEPDTHSEPDTYQPPQSLYEQLASTSNGETHRELLREHICKDGKLDYAFTARTDLDSEQDVRTTMIAAITKEAMKEFAEHKGNANYEHVEGAVRTSIAYFAANEEVAPMMMEGMSSSGTLDCKL